MNSLLARKPKLTTAPDPTPQPLPKPNPEQHNFGSVRYNLGEDAKAIRLQSIEGFEEVDTYQTDVYLRNGRAVQVTWLSVDEMLKAIDALTDRRFVGFTMPGQDESYLAITPDAVDECSATPNGSRLYLTSGRSITIAGLSPSVVRQRLA